MKPFTLILFIIFGCLEAKAMPVALNINSFSSDKQEAVKLDERPLSQSVSIESKS